MTKKIFVLLFAFSLANVVLISCNKECCNKEEEKPLLFTIHIDVGAITTDAAWCIVNLIPKPGSEEVLNSHRRFGVMWDDKSYPIFNSSDKVEESSIGTKQQYICHLTDLEPNTTYYIQGFAFFPEMESQYYFSCNVVEITTLPCYIEEEEVVVINGIRWATRNVDRPGTFATKMEDAGLFYQWNCKIGWSSTNPMVNSNGGTTWDSSTPSGTTWEPANDPSPPCYRVPTKEEIEKLLDETYVTNVWTTENGVQGRRFTDKANGNSIFLPAAGSRNYSNGTLLDVGMDGGYWSSAQSSASNVYRLCFGSGHAYLGNHNKSSGFSVRPVVK